MAVGIAAILSALAPLLMAGASGLGSYFGAKSGSGGSQGFGGQPQFGSQGGFDAMKGLGQQPSVTDMPGGGKLTQYSRLDPQQQQLKGQLLSMLQGQLGQGGEDPIASQARKQFKEVGLPGLLERFTAAGSTLQGGGVRDAILRAQTDLEGQLAGRQYGMLQNLLGQGLQPQQEQYFTPKEPNAMMKALGIFGEPILKGIGDNLSASFQAKYGL